MWVEWIKQYRGPKSRSGHVCQNITWTRPWDLVLYKGSEKQLAHSKVAQPELAAYSAPSLFLILIAHPARMPDGPAKNTTRNWPRWSCLHIDFIGPLNGSYYLIVVDNFSQLPEMLGCNKQTTGVVIGFLHELFIRFGVPYSIVSNNATQLISKEFKGFCKMCFLENITIVP